MTVYDLTGTGGSTSTGSARMEVALALVALGACASAGAADLKLIKGLRLTQAGLQVDVATDLVRLTQAGLQIDTLVVPPIRITQAGLQVDARKTVPVDVTQAGLQTDGAGDAVRLTQAGVQVDGRSVRPEVALNCWEFHVTDRWGTYLAFLDGAFEKGYLAQLNEVGSGSFRMHVNDPKATSTNLAIGNVVLVRYRNVDVGAFVIEEVGEALVGPDEEPGQIIDVSGRGLLSGLEAGLVYPGDLADPATTTRQFTAQTRAGILLTLYNEFMARGGGDLSPDFSATHDSGLALWTDSTTLDVKAGGSLLATAKSLCALGLDLTVEMPGRVLRAWLAAGVDRRATVVFRHGQNLLTCGRQRSGRELVNAVLAEGQGLLVESVDGAAAGAYGRREGYLTAGNSADVTQVTAASALLLAQRKAPATALELTVTPYEFFPLLDYGLGDTITLDGPGGVSGAYRVLSVAIREQGGPCELAVTLEVNSLALAYLVRMQKQLEASQTNAASQASATTGLAHGETRAPVLAGHTHVEADITDLAHDAAQLQGRALAATAPTDGQAVVWDAAGSSWKPGTVSGGSGGGIPAPATPEQGDVLYYNGAAWVALGHGTAGQVLASGGHGANPAWAAAAAAGIPPPATPEQGDVLYYNGAAWVALVHGTAGQVLASGGHGANPAWATVSGGVNPMTTQGDLVYYHGGTSANLALASAGATFTASDYYGTDTPAHACDGDDATWWNCNGGGLASWLRVNLGSSQALVAFRVKQYTPHHATSWKIQYSADLSTWVDAYAGSVAGDTGKVDFAAVITARYWQLIPVALNSSPYWDIYTFELWSEPAMASTRLPIGTEGQVLMVVSGVPVWVTP